MDAILEQFLGEARENLSYLDQNLDQLSQNDPEVVNALFRAAHTLKGGAGLVGLDGIKTLTHHAEDLLDGIKKGTIEYSDDMLEALYDSFDEAVEMIDAAEEIGGIPEYDVDKIEAISKNIESLINKEDDDSTDDTINTELNIVLEEDVIVGDLINTKSIDRFIKDLSIENHLNQEFIENEHIYLVDIDLEEDTCSYGNDPIYLIYLLEEDNIFTINTYLYADCENKESDKTLWKTRITLVTKSNETGLEDAFYNIIDDIKIYPLSIKSLLTTEKESMQNDVLGDFINDFKKMTLENNFSELTEKISAIIKVLNPESKESFILERALLILSSLEFDSLDYLEMIKYIAFMLGVKEEDENESESIDNVEVIETTDETAIKDEEVLELTPERLNAVNILKQQLKVLECSGDDGSLSRVKLFVTRALDFINMEHNFNIEDNSEAIFEKIKEYICKIDPSSEVANMKYTEKCPMSEEIEEPQASQESKDEEDMNISKQEVEHNVDTPQKENAFIVEKKDTQEVKQEIKTTPTPSTTVEKKEEPKKEQKTTEVKEKAVAGHAAVPKTVKIEQTDIDSMMDIIGELLVMKNSLPYVANNIKTGNTENARAELMAKYEEISRVTDMLQDKIMGMRLLPMSYIFSRYPKLIRDISKVLNKKIKFEESGGETKLDKMMIEKIADPLVHIIRNSLDHGIEPTSQDRVEAGKDPVGYIKVSAKSVGDKVEICIEDDGQGIDLQKVLIKAISLGLIKEEDIDTMSEQEKLMMIFNPGLSTKDEVSELSGRGVGTDAVKKTIDELGGKIFLESKSGIGTKLTIELPVSVALSNVFHVKMNSNNYAIAMDNIVETIKIKKEDIQIANQKPFARLRGEIIPLIFEPILLPKGQEDEEIQSVVIIQGKVFRFGLVVNEFVNQLDVVQKPLDGILNNHPIISGTSLLGNGDVLFIIDPNKIVGD